MWWWEAVVEKFKNANAINGLKWDNHLKWTSKNPRKGLSARPQIAQCNLIWFNLCGTCSLIELGFSVPQYFRFRFLKLRAITMKENRKKRWEADSLSHKFETQIQGYWVASWYHIFGTPCMNSIQAPFISQKIICKSNEPKAWWVKRLTFLTPFF